MLGVDELIADCQDAIEGPCPPAAVAKILGNKLYDCDAVIETFGDPEETDLTTLYRTSALTLMYTVWRPGQALPPHEHRMWSVTAVCMGSLEQLRWNRRPEGIREGERVSLTAGDVAWLRSDQIVSVASWKEGYSAAIQVFGGDLFSTRRNQWNDPHTAHQYDCREWSRDYRPV